MSAVALARVRILADLVEVVVALEQAVLQHEPVRVLRHVRTQHGGAELRVVLRGEVVADVVQESGHHELLALARTQRPGRRLQRVLVAVDPIPRQTARELLEVRKHAVAGLRDVGLAEGVEERVVLDRPRVHPGEADDPAPVPARHLHRDDPPVRHRA